MSLQAVADIVAKGDPDRFDACMAAPVAARVVLFPIYAFNVEVARATWVMSEPKIGELRLQWLRDALEDIARGKAARKHEVIAPLADVLDSEGAQVLDRLVQARWRDLHSQPFGDVGQFREYLDATGGGLMWVAARALGGDDEAGFRALGRISGLANFLLAVPRLNARMDWPLPVGGPETVQQLARDALTELRALQLPKAGRAASLASWRAGTILRRAADEPDRVAHGTLPESEFRRRLSLIWAGYRL
ncbi:MAG: phytoene synthase [Boseongicola sp. SB0664_bin_43]|uniref:Phytoene synthase n=1 Tax=Boseongicola sp. SB0664_bin_43 TaxID=2604844 RepID=A0A6B0XYW3_9RHOB|nr:phytoene synthase [Boseongicola sp. SB0664_bin_43]MYK32217.1 phytoene synthase [Boseongicola sp. SB0670_bin_30]